MTLLIASISAERLSEVHARAECAWRCGADAVEIRIDAFEDEPAELAKYLNDHRNRTWIVTCRSAAEGGRFDGDTSQRVSRLLAAAGPSDAYVDFEFADWRRSSNIRQKVRLAAARPGGADHRLVLSSHDLDAMPKDPAAVVGEMHRANPGVVAKIAYLGNEAVDSFAALDLVHEHGRGVTALCMGEYGAWTRVLAKKLGAFATYAALSAESATAPGQLTLDEMVSRYRWKDMDSSTRVFGVLGDPIAHSMSPLLFNTWFEQGKINAVYLPLRVQADRDGLTRFLDGCMDRPWLDLGGFSVTLPHKSTALCWLGGAADAQARSIGAVNTLVFGDGTRAGYNTDCEAAVGSLLDALGCSRSDLADLPVDVLGTGGAARAVLAGLRDTHCAVTVFGRSARKTRALAHAFACQPAAWEDRARRPGRILINATRVGMWPDTNASPMPADSLAGVALVFDLIYNPLETALLRAARAVGAVALGGLDMFVRQAARQFERWTRRTPDTHLAKRLITAEIEQRAGTRP